MAQFVIAAFSTAENVWKVQWALENASMIFIYADEEGPGVRLKANPAGQ